MLAVVIEAPQNGFVSQGRIYRSLIRQTHANWRLYIIGGGRDDRVLDRDSRVTVVQGSRDWVAGVEYVLATTEASYVMFSTQDGEFFETALAEIAECADVHEADLIYGDERIGSKRSSRIVFKPDFSPERLRCQFYLGQPVFYRTDLVRRLGGLRGNLPGAEFYDLALRASREELVVRHIREQLFILPEGSPEPGAVSGESGLESTRAALAEHLEKTGGGYVEAVSANGVHRTHREVAGEPLVSIIIPTRGSVGEVRGEARCLVIDCVRSIVEKSTYQNYELVIVIDSIAKVEVVEALRLICGARLRLVTWDKPFNFSAKMNRGVFHSRGEYLIFLNDDTEVASEAWIEPMLSLCQRPGAGMAGAMLYFEDDSIQHAGHIYEGGDAGHIGTYDVRGSAGPLGSYLVEREVSGVTAACSTMPRRVFDDVGGFSLLLPGNFNDVDLCMKVNQLGYTIYWTPNSELYHYESKTRVSRVARYEVETAWGRWEWRLDDPTYWPYGGSLKLPVHL